MPLWWKRRSISWFDGSALKDFFMLHKFWAKTAALFLIRSKRSTIVLYLMIVSAVCILIFLASLAEGVNDAMIKNSIGIFCGHISGIGVAYPPEEKELLKDGVSGVLKRVPTPGMLSSGKVFDPVTLIFVDPSEEKRLTALWKKTIAGRYLKPHQKEIYLSKKTADRLNVRPKDSVSFSIDTSPVPVSLAVSGVYETGIDLLDRGVAFCPFGSVPLNAKTGDLAVFLRDGVDPEKMVSDYRRLIGGRPGRFAAWSELMPDLKQLIDLNYISMNIVIGVVFGVVSLGIACAFTIFILKNLREYGIMKAMGVMPSEIALLIVSEVVIINAAASAIGMIAGAVAVFIVGKIGIDLSGYTSHNPYFVVSGVIYPRLTAYSLWIPPLSAFVFSIVSAVWPAAFIAGKSAADILRTR
jgi:ABC-type lipoprotein release transport system permease subunit